jgi:hypothetical protein
MLISQDGGSDGGAIVTTPADEHEPVRVGRTGELISKELIVPKSDSPSSRNLALGLKLDSLFGRFQDIPTGWGAGDESVLVNTGGQDMSFLYKVDQNNM